MNTQLTRSRLPRFNSFMRISAFIAFVALIGIPLFSRSSASSIRKISGTERASKSQAAQFTQPGSKPAQLFRSGFESARFLLNPNAMPGGETIEIFAADCTTPKVSFNLGETICAKTNGVDLSVANNYYVDWTGPNGTTNDATITQNPQYSLFSLPTSGTEVGLWKPNIGRVTPAEPSIIGNPPNFTVSVGPAIATFAANCTTPKTGFVLGDMVCARITGESLPDAGNDVPVQRHFNWINSAGRLASSTDVTTDPQTNTFTLSMSATARGAWLVSAADNDGNSHINTGFSVSDPAALSTDLTVNASSPLTVSAGSDLLVTVRVANYGPDSAAAVQLTDAQPANTTFVSATQTAGTAAFSCTGSTTVTCTAASMAKGDEALFVMVYNVNSGTSDGTVIADVVNVSSSTTELKSADNTFETASIVDAGTPPSPSCNLVCPDNITVTANTTENSVVGAHVSFEAAQLIGDCGAISTSKPSGSFFPVGTTTVSVTSATNGGSCSFNVMVTQAPLTITCPASQTVTAAVGDTTANVNPGTPTTNPATGVTVSGVRSDDDDDPGTPPLSLTAPYSIGVTYITWTVRETSTGRTAICTQAITVNAAGRPNLTISCPADQTVAAPSGSCQATVNPGTPTTNPSDSNVTVVGTRSDGQALSSPFPAGATNITWSASDAVNGQSASCTQTITVTTDSGDTTPPTFTHVPGPVSVTTSSCGQIVEESVLGTAEATDTGNNCSPGTVTMTRTGVPAGNFFPTGTTTITYKATDAAGNFSTATQTVTVTESPAVPPTISAPAAISVNTGAGATSCGTVVGDATLGTASASDNCAGVTVTRTGVPSGNIFPVGTTVVTYTATDKSGNTASDTQNVTVVDNTVPIVTPPATVTLYTGPGATSCGLTVSNLDTTLGTGSATDNCPGVGAVSRSGVPSGNTFPVGNTTVTYSATDAHGNTGSATQTVTVVDNTVPIVTPPAAVTLYTGPGATSCGVTVSNLDTTLGTGSATDNCPGVGAVSRSGVPSGNTFPVGNTTVTYSATDAHGNTGSATQTVTVVDNTAPVISCPSNITIEPTCPTGAKATYATPTATDNCAVQSIARTAGGASGSVFPIGTTTVTHLATDIYGNTSSCSFTVTVLTPQAVLQNLINSVNASSLSPTTKGGLTAKLQAALTVINGGGGNACAKLSDFVNNVGTLISHGDITAAQGNAWISSANHVQNTIGCTSLPCS